MELLPVDTANKKVSIRNSKGEYEESYDALVLSPGAKALRPPIPGIDNKHILTLRNVPDADALRDLSLHYPEGKAVVIGGGFVGIEVAEKVAQGLLLLIFAVRLCMMEKALGLGTLFPCTIDTDNI